MRAFHHWHYVSDRNLTAEFCHSMDKVPTKFLYLQNLGKNFQDLKISGIKRAEENILYMI